MLSTLMIPAILFSANFKRVQPQYDLIDLGPVASLNALNDNKLVVGTRAEVNGESVRYQAFAYSRSQGFVNLLSLGGPNSYATDVNNAGQIVGYSDTEPNRFSATLWEGGQPQNLGGLSVDGWGIAESISQNGIIVGDSLIHPDPFPERIVIHGFLLDTESTDTTLRDLGSLNPDGFNDLSHAAAVNDHRITVGNSWPPGIAFQAVLWDENHQIQLLPRLPGHSSSWAAAINNSDLVVGYSWTGRQHATAWERGLTGEWSVRLLLGPQMDDRYTSEAKAVNDRGEIVGWFYDSREMRAFLISGQRFVDVNDRISADNASRYLIENAVDINKDGDIAAVGRRRGTTESRGFLLIRRTPTQPSIQNR